MTKADNTFHKVEGYKPDAGGRAYGNGQVMVAFSLHLKDGVYMYVSDLSKMTNIALHLSPDEAEELALDILGRLRDNGSKNYGEG